MEKKMEFLPLIADNICRISSKAASVKLNSALESRDLTLLLQVLLGKEDIALDSMPTTSTVHE